MTFPFASNYVPQISYYYLMKEIAMNSENILYKVVVNSDEQFSIWLSDQENPLGWREVGVSGTKQECLSYIEEVWTDMRPFSLQENMKKEIRKDD